MENYLHKFENEEQHDIYLTNKYTEPYVSVTDRVVEYNLKSYNFIGLGNKRFAIPEYDNETSYSTGTKNTFSNGRPTTITGKLNGQKLPLKINNKQVLGYLILNATTISDIVYGENYALHPDDMDRWPQHRGAQGNEMGGGDGGNSEGQAQYEEGYQQSGEEYEQDWQEFQASQLPLHVYPIVGGDENANITCVGDNGEEFTTFAYFQIRSYTPKRKEYLELSNPPENIEYNDEDCVIIVREHYGLLDNGEYYMGPLKKVLCVNTNYNLPNMGPK